MRASPSYTITFTTQELRLLLRHLGNMSNSGYFHDGFSRDEADMMFAIYSDLDDITGEDQ